MPNLSKGCNFVRSGRFEVTLFQHQSMLQNSLTLPELVKQGIKMLEIAEEQKMFHLFLLFSLQCGQTLQNVHEGTAY